MGDQGSTQYLGQFALCDGDAVRGRCSRIRAWCVAGRGHGHDVHRRPQVGLGCVRRRSDDATNLLLHLFYGGSHRGRGEAVDTDSDGFVTQKEAQAHTKRRRARENAVAVEDVSGKPVFPANAEGEAAKRKMLSSITNVTSGDKRPVAHDRREAADLIGQLQLPDFLASRRIQSQRGKCPVCKVDFPLE